MKLTKDNFLDTKLDAGLKSTIRALDYHLAEIEKFVKQREPERFKQLIKSIDILLAQWNAYKMNLKENQRGAGKKEEERA